MAQGQERLVEIHARPPPPVARPELPVEPACERFRTLNPPVFEGDGDPLVAEEWIRTLETMFEYTGIIGADRVICSTYYLRRDSTYWWETVRATTDIANMTWDEFKECFFGKYFTYTHRVAKMEEFLQLRQGFMSVTDYIRRFEELSRFATHIVAHESLKVEHFIKGFTAELYRSICGFITPTTTFTKASHRTLKLEQGEHVLARARTQQQFRNSQQRQMQYGARPRAFMGHPDKKGQKRTIHESSSGAGPS